MESSVQYIEMLRYVIGAFGFLVCLLFGIIAYFLRKIHSRIELSQTIASCSEKTFNCLEVRKVRQESNDRERISMMDDLKDLRNSFDSLSQCISKFTKGDCP